MVFTIKGISRVVFKRLIRNIKKLMNDEVFVFELSRCVIPGV